jgi:hypothetical protein
MTDQPRLTPDSIAKIEAAGECERAVYSSDPAETAPAGEKHEGFEPGTFGCHEALHMASFLAGAVDEELCNHPAIEQNPDWLKLARTAAQALADLHQKIGAAHL